MRVPYIAPVRGAPAFNCPRCGAYAQQRWATLSYGFTSERVLSKFRASRCAHCEKLCFWHEETLILPAGGIGEQPHADLPDELAADFNEARAIVGASPRAAAALMRLVVQKLMRELGQSGTNINDDIRSLVAAGLPVPIQQALDFCRVVGNNSVHPGALQVDDDPEIAHQLFTMVNHIVEDRIARPRQIREMYDKLPAGAREAVAKRDGSPAQ